jgi:hypothetical protein
MTSATTQLASGGRHAEGRGYGLILFASVPLLVRPSTLRGTLTDVAMNGRAIRARVPQSDPDGRQP